MKFGIIGRNFVVDSMMQAAALVPGLEGAAIYSRTREGADIFGEKYAIDRRYTSLEELAGDPELDFIYIASPNSEHYRQARLMLEANKHVFLEKPLVPTSQQAEQLYSLARERGLVLMEAMMPAHTPSLAVLRSLLPRIGRVRSFSFNFCQYSSRYDKFRAGIVENAFRPELCNGAIMDLGVYCLELAVLLFGMPQRVSAASHLLSTGVDGVTCALLSYPEAVGTVTASKITQATLPSFIQGEEGSVELDFVSHPEVFTLKLRSGVSEKTDATPERPIMCYELEDMMRAIAEVGRGTRSVADEFEGYTRHTVALLEQIRG